MSDGIEPDSRPAHGLATGAGASPMSASGAENSRGIPPASLARLPIYLRVLTNLLADDVDRVSSDELAEAAGVNSPQLRRDLSHLGTYGTRGVGYDVRVLMTEISQALGLTKQWRVAIIGAGNLGRALAGYSGFGTRGFDVAAIFDEDQLVVGTEIGYLRVAPMGQLEQVLELSRVNMVVLAVPGAVAQRVADRVIAVGINSILSFAPVVLQVPDHVNVRKVDVATELQILAYHAQRAQDPDFPESRAL